jgi:6-phosphofructokinase 1
MGKVGAVIVYTPEVGINLDTLRDDVKILKMRYGLDEKGESEGRVVIRYVGLTSSHCYALSLDLNRNEKASNIYTTEVITKIFKEEGSELFDARSASLGHTLQGGVPSPLDRVYGVRFALKSMAFIEKHHEQLREQKFKARTAGPESAAVITLQNSAIKYVPVQEMAAHADMKNRRGKNAWWGEYKGLVERLAARPQLL